MTAGVRTIGNRIGGKSVPTQDGRTLDDLSPATNKVIARIPRSAKADVDAAVAAAKAAFSAWSLTPVRERAAALERVADLIEKRKEEFARLEMDDAGKTITQARTVDIPRAILNFRFFAGEVRHHGSDHFPMEGAINYTLYKPLGVVGLITPWNLPLYLLTWKIAPAIAMGNTVVAKPSELTPLSADLLMDVVAEAGIPPGVVNIIHGLGPEAGAAIVSHPDVKAISFTGGTKTGQEIARTAAPMLKKLSLELGGKNPTIVFADADLDAAVQGAFRAGFTNTGQVCLCGSRILVEKGLFETFLDRFVSRVESAKLGDPSDPATELGALISSQHREKVESYIQLAKKEGGNLLTGGNRPAMAGEHKDGNWLQPTVITGLKQSSACIQEEIFGPVVTVQSFADEAEAVRLANDVRYGLAASVWTTDLGKAHRVSAALDTGMVWVNTWLLRDLRVPFGGMKDSGIGREGGRYSLEFFSESRNVCVKL